MNREERLAQDRATDPVLFYRELWERWETYGTHVATWEEVWVAVQDEAR